VIGEQPVTRCQWEENENWRALGMPYATCKKLHGQIHVELQAVCSCSRLCLAPWAQFFHVYFPYLGLKDPFIAPVSVPHFWVRISKAFENISLYLLKQIHTALAPWAKPMFLVRSFDGPSLCSTNPNSLTFCFKL
jgi:hypothetical protein